MRQCATFLCLRLNRLGVVEDLLGVVLRLEALQPGKMVAVVLELSLGTRKPGIGVVDVRAPFRPRDGVGDSVDPAVEETKRRGRVSLVVLITVVELDDVELVTMRVRSVVLADLGDLRVLATVHVELEEPEAVDDLVGDIEVVVDKSLGGSSVEALEGQALGVEVLLRAGVDPVNLVIVGVSDNGLDPVEGLGLGNVVALREGVQERLEGLRPLSRSTVVQTLDTRLSLVIVANTEVDFTGHDVLGVFLNSFKTGNGSVLSPSKRDTEFGEYLGRCESAQLPRSNDTEVRTGALDTPEEISVRSSGSLLHAPVSQNNGNTLDEVQGKTVHVGAETEASMEEVAGNTDTRCC